MLQNDKLNTSEAPIKRGDEAANRTPESDKKPGPDLWRFTQRTSPIQPIPPTHVPSKRSRGLMEFDLLEHADTLSSTLRIPNPKLYRHHRP